ncbi:MAG: hypothetical protein ACRD5E_11550 [Nitrososphaeraceae archaeon]
MLASRRCFLLAKEGGRIVQLPIEAGSDGIFVKVDLAKGEGNLKKSVKSLIMRELEKRVHH